MPDFELFNGTSLEEPDNDHRIAMNKPSLAGAFYVRWDAFKNLIRTFTVSKDTNQSISGNKTFTGIVNIQTPTSDNNPVTLKYFNDNAGGGEEIIEVDTYANLPAIGDASVLYVVLDENVLYRWSGTVYVSMSSPLSYASQAEIEVTPATENTKVVTPLRAWEGFVFWCKNTIFAELNTAAKTVIGALNELAANTLKGNTTVHTPLIDADSFGVWDSVNSVFKRISAASIKTYVKSGLKASEVKNDSNALGATVKDVLDAAEAVEVQTVQDDYILAMARDNNGVSENVFVKTANAKPYFAGAGNGTFIYVSTADEFVAAIGMEYSIIEICVTKPITVNPFFSVYADNVYITGCEITLPDTLVSCNKTSTGTVTNYLINNALLFDVTDPIASVIVVTDLGGMARTWNITVREFKTTRPLGVLVTAGCQLNLITGNRLILDAQQLVGTYTATVDATLDLGQESIRLDGSNVLDVSPAILPGDKMLIKKGNYNFELVDVAAFAGSLSGIILGSLKYETTVDFTTVGQVFEIGQIPTGYELRRVEATSTAQVNVDLLCTYPDTTVEQVNSWYQVQGNLIVTAWDLFAVSKTITPLQGVGKFEALSRYTRNTHADNIVVSVRSQDYTDTTMLFKVLVHRVI